MLSPEEQERIGATPNKSDSMRVLRVLSEYNRLLESKRRDDILTAADG